MFTQRLRHRITIQQQFQSQDSNTGDVETTWEDFYSDVPAEVLTGPGRESVVDATKTAEVEARINFRWLPDLDESMRVVWDGIYFDISSIDYDRTARREVRMKCKSGLTDGR